MKIAIAGYGELGIAAEKAALSRNDVTLTGIFTRREPVLVKKHSDAPIYSFSQIYKHEGEFDVVINCMGSANDLPVTTPYLSKYFNVVDSYDNHSEFESHFKRTDFYAKQSGKLALIGCGWDPGLFSLARAYMTAALPNGKNYTFWGEGVSRGHSNAVKNVEGVLDAVEYTVPIDEAVKRVKANEFPLFADRDMHKRVCYVVAEPGANTQRIRDEIVSMPGYFEPYDTEVNFIDYESFLCEHRTQKHAGSVIRCMSDEASSYLMEFSLKLSSNPYFTAMVLLAYAFAVDSMSKSGKSGCITVFDVPVASVLNMTRENLMKLI